MRRRSWVVVVVIIACVELTPTPAATLDPLPCPYPAAEERDGVLVGLDLAHHADDLPVVLPHLRGVDAGGALVVGVTGVG